MSVHSSAEWAMERRYKQEEREMEEENNETFPLKLIQSEYAWTIQAYLRFANIEFVEENVQYMSLTSTGELPQLQDGHKLVPAKDIISYLEATYNLDNNISPDDQLDSVPFIELIQNALHNIYVSPSLYKRWDPYHPSTLYPNFKCLSFPYSVYYSMTTMKKTLQLLADRGYNNETENHDNLCKYLRVFENKLDYDGFIYGDKPSVLDAYFFGYIATVYNANIGMQPLIKRYTKIYEYYNRIMTRYFTVARGEELSTNEWIKLAKLNIGTHVSKSTECLPYVLPSPSLSEPEEWVPKNPEENKNDEDDETKVSPAETRSNQLFYLLAGGSFALYLLFSVLLEIEYVE